MRRAVRRPRPWVALLVTLGVAGPLAAPASAASVIWTAQFGTREADEADAVAVDPAGNLYVAGQTFGALPGHTSEGMIDAFLRRYDAHGVEIWTRQFGSSERD